MKLSFDQIKDIMTGAVRFEETEQALVPLRFTKEQEAVYEATSAGSLLKCFASAGMKFWFKTDSKKLYLKVETAVAFSRKYFSYDVFVNGELLGYLDNFSDTGLQQEYISADLPVGEFEKEFDLGEGEKEVCVHFPFGMKSTIKEVRVDDGASIEPCKPTRKLLVYGDSISQGYDALRPSNRYTARIADALGAEEINKAIGGEKFLPELAKFRDNFTPDYVLVAYGTNDWSAFDEEEMRTKCREFYKIISENYKESKIFAITPIWRKDFAVPKNDIPFEDVERYIREETKDLDNVTVISGFDLVPGDEKYFADLKVHPNDAGFDFFYKNLIRKIDELRG